MVACSTIVVDANSLNTSMVTILNIIKNCLLLMKILNYFAINNIIKVAELTLLFVKLVVCLLANAC